MVFLKNGLAIKVFARHWHQGQLPWGAWCVLSGVLTLAFIAELVFGPARQERATEMEGDLFAYDVSSTRVGRSAEARIDYTQNFPAEAGTVAWIQTLPFFATKLGVSVVNITDTPHAATPTQLGRHDLQLILRGPYPQIKLVLKELLDRYPTTTVGRLTLRAMTNPLDVEVSVQLIRWTRPLLVVDRAAPRAMDASR